jgi:hypothetical protein
MSQTNSALMSIITQYTKQFVDRISELENENNQLKQKVDVVPSGLKAEFDKLTERHSELKISYAEIERENTKLRQDMNQLISQQDSLQSDIAKHFQQVFSGFTTKQTEQLNTPRKTSSVKFSSVPPSQKPIYREAKATTKLLNTEYESDSSDSETDDEMPALVPISDDESSNFAPRKLRFDVRPGQDPNKSFGQSPYSDSEPIKLNISEILHKDDESSEDEDENDNYETILKQIITEGLMSGLENINRSPHNAARLNIARANSRNAKRNRPYSASKKHRPSMHHQQSRAAQTENPNENTNPFKFNFMFPQQPHTQGLNSNAQGLNSNAQGLNNNSQGHTNQNQTHSQEAELVQKILESLFTPNK